MLRYGLNAGFVSCKKKNRNAKNMASAGARAYMGVWGRCSQRGPGAEPLVRGAKPPPLKLKAFYCRREQYAEKDRNGVPAITKRTGTAFRLETNPDHTSLSTRHLSIRLRLPTVSIPQTKNNLSTGLGDLGVYLNRHNFLECSLS